MDVDRPHRSGSSTSELFVCFNSRLSSSSSMKISSKSILSPGRTRETSQISLSSSLSRRLRTNGSIKGGQASPMFPTVGKKRGCAFETPEPSSPKVTCIGQVRVKTKKQGRKMRARSKRRQGEVSFRKVEQSGISDAGSLQGHSHHNNQSQQECLPQRNHKWVHLPMTICEALRAFGAEFNCFLPCRSSCMSSCERDKDVKAARSGCGDGNTAASSCGAVFARWLVSLQEGDAKGRQIELVVGEEEAPDTSRSPRRHVFEGIEIEDDKEEEGRVSICIPPKNALLLMRCRSDPLKMAALANRLWEPPLPGDQEDEDDEIEIEEAAEGRVIDKGKENEEVHEEEEAAQGECRASEAQVAVADANSILKEGDDAEERRQQEGEMQVEDSCEGGACLSSSSHDAEKQGSEEGESNSSEGLEEEGETERVAEEEHKEGDEERMPSLSSSFLASLLHSESEEEMEEQGKEQEEAEDLEEAQVLAEEANETADAEEDEETVTHKRPQPQNQEDDPNEESKTKPSESEAQAERVSPVLPDCLLLMMREPKLSMEVSKETWVCGADFIRWLPERQVNRKKKKKKTADGGEESKERLSTDSNPHQPPRSSCHYPSAAAAAAAAGAGGVSMASIIEQRLVNAKAYEPFVLTRCKSEPMRSSAKFAADGCFWKNNKLEPHRPATLGVGAAGVGF